MYFSYALQVPYIKLLDSVKDFVWKTSWLKMLVFIQLRLERLSDILSVRCRTDQILLVLYGVGNIWETIEEQ